VLHQAENSIAYLIFMNRWTNANHLACHLKPRDVTPVCARRNWICAETLHAIRTIHSDRADFHQEIVGAGHRHRPLNEHLLIPTW
jgi:hypothetical protein